MDLAQTGWRPFRQMLKLAVERGVDGYVMFAGQTAARLMASEGRKIAEGLPPAKRAEMLQLCDEVDMLTDQLGSLCKKGLVGCYVTITVCWDFSE